MAATPCSRYEVFCKFCIRLIGDFIVRINLKITAMCRESLKPCGFHGILEIISFLLHEIRERQIMLRVLSETPPVPPAWA